MGWISALQNKHKLMHADDGWVSGTTILQQLINSLSWAVIVSDGNSGKEANGGSRDLKVTRLCIFENGPGRVWEA